MLPKEVPASTVSHACASGEPGDRGRGEPDRARAGRRGRGRRGRIPLAYPDHCIGPAGRGSHGGGEGTDAGAEGGRVLGRPAPAIWRPCGPRSRSRLRARRWGKPRSGWPRKTVSLARRRTSGRTARTPAPTAASRTAGWPRRSLRSTWRPRSRRSSIGTTEFAGTRASRRSRSSGPSSIGGTAPSRPETPPRSRTAVPRSSSCPRVPPRRTGSSPSPGSGAMPRRRSTRGAQLLQGPAYAAPIALDRAGITMSDVDLMEMHEAFAAQVLSNLQALEFRRVRPAEAGPGPGGRAPRRGSYQRDGRLHRSGAPVRRHGAPASRPRWLGSFVEQTASSGSSRCALPAAWASPWSSRRG